MATRQLAVSIFAAGAISFVAAVVFSAWYIGLLGGQTSAPAPPPAPVAVTTPPPAAAPPAPAPAPPPTPEAIAAAFVPKPSDIGMGKPDAPIKWVEYTSAGCPHCAEQSLKVLPRIKKAYIDTGKVYYVLRDYPLDGASAAASMLARCLPKQKFYAFMDTLFTKQNEWHSPDTKDPKAALFGLAAKAGLDNKAAEACTKDQARFDTVKAIAQEANLVLGVDGTPKNFIDGVVLGSGALTFEALEAKFKEKLGK